MEFPRTANIDRILKTGIFIEVLFTGRTSPTEGRFLPSGNAGCLENHKFARFDALSDRLDAYHEKMEQILAGKYGGFSPDGISSIREDAAVLLYLVSDVERFAPATIKADSSFAEGLTGLTASSVPLSHPSV